MCSGIVLVNRMLTISNGAFHRVAKEKACFRFVLKNGQIVEKGAHHQLVKNKAEYFNLVKNQLELGS